MLEIVWELRPYKRLQFQFSTDEEQLPFITPTPNSGLLTAGAGWMRRQFPSAWASFVAARMQGKTDVVVGKQWWGGFATWPKDDPANSST